MACINACKYHEHFENGLTDAFFSKSILFVFFCTKRKQERNAKVNFFLSATVIQPIIGITVAP